MMKGSDHNKLRRRRQAEETSSQPVETQRKAEERQRKGRGKAEERSSCSKLTEEGDARDVGGVDRVAPSL